MKLRRKKIKLGEDRIGKPRRKGSVKMVKAQLSVLGLASRVQESISDDRMVGRLFPLTSRVVKCLRFASPHSPEKYLLIKEMRGAPDGNDWIADSHHVRVPFWIRKRDLVKLRLVEDALDAMNRQRLK